MNEIVVVTGWPNHTVIFRHLIVWLDAKI